MRRRVAGVARRSVPSLLMEYFAVLGLEPRLSIDLQDLERRFYSRSRELHPDRFVRAPKEQQQRALEESSLLNDAYRTLKDSIDRAEYVLEKHGVDSKAVPPDLLEEMFELNMAKEEGEDVSERLQQMLNEIDTGLPAKFAAWDASQSRPALEEIRAALNRRKYVQNMVHPHV